MERRHDPDEWLKMVQQETKHHRGQLKIFFGYAAGVGKTYAMLSAARELKRDGIDVVAGYIEPHARPETMALLEGLEQLPTKEIIYKTVTLQEFDLDAAIARRPQVILVDELAHTNGVGCRHAKRYMDIEELLDAGIDVLTTVNVQHLESLNDIVAAITQIAVKERIPDRIFDEADQVELVDIEPEELLNRLEDGKIYAKQQADQAQEHFFSKGNLAALREVALRRMVDRVNDRVDNNRTLSGGQYYTEEHILICLSGSPSNSRVIRTAARMANAFRGAFTALYVETPQMAERTATDQERLNGNIKLAEQLGAKVTTVYGQDLAKTIAEYALVAGVSKVVLGRSNNKRILGGKPNLSEQLILLAPELDLYIIPDNQPAYDRRPLRRALLKRQVTWQRSGIFAMLLVGAVLLGYGFDGLGFSQSTIIMGFMLGAFLTAFWTGSWLYGAVAPVVYILAFNFFFTQPRYTFFMHDVSDLVTCAVLIITTLLTSSVTLKIKEQSKLSAIWARRTEVLLETSQKLQRAMDLSEIIDEACGQFMRLLECSVVFYLVGLEGLEKPMVFSYQNHSVDKLLSADGQAVAAWVARNNKAAGRSTDTLTGAKGLYLPISNREQVLAVLGVALPHERSRLRPLERGLLTAMLNETAFAIEKYQLGERQKQIVLEADRERLRADLLRAISHDLRTPLTSISGNASILMTEKNQLSKETTHKLLEDIYDDAQWLINLVENLLSVTRIDNGTMELHTTVELLADVVDEAMRHISRKKTEHQIMIQKENDWLMARIDAQLIVQVIVNIVNNAIKYTDVGSCITVDVRKEGSMAIVEVGDDGAGITDENKSKLFDRFFTIKQNLSDSRRGLGLGLSLCQSIIRAHGGEIYVRDNQPTGTIVGFTVPTEEVGDIETDDIGR